MDGNAWTAISPEQTWDATWKQVAQLSAQDTQSGYRCDHDIEYPRE